MTDKQMIAEIKSLHKKIMVRDTDDPTLLAYQKFILEYIRSKTHPDAF